MCVSVRSPELEYLLYLKMTTSRFYLVLFHSKRNDQGLGTSTTPEEIAPSWRKDSFMVQACQT